MLPNFPIFTASMSLIAKRFLFLDTPEGTNYKISSGTLKTDATGKPLQVPTSSEASASWEQLKKGAETLQEAVSISSSDQEAIRKKVSELLKGVDDKSFLELIRGIEEDAKEQGKAESVNTELLASKKELLTEKEARKKALEDNKKDVDGEKEKLEGMYEQVKNMLQKIKMDEARLRLEDQEDRALMGMLEGSLGGASATSSKYSRPGNRSSHAASIEEFLTTNISRNDAAQATLRELKGEIESLLGINDDEMEMLLALDTNEFDKAFTSKMQEKARMKQLTQRLEKIAADMIALSTKISTLKTEIDEAETKGTSAEATEKALKERLKKRRAALEAAKSFTQIKDILTAMIATREAVDSLYEEVDQACQPYETLSITHEQFEAFKRSLEAKNAELSDDLLSLYSEAKEDLLQRVKIMDKDFSLDAEFDAKEKAFKAEIQKRKNVSCDLTKLKEDPDKTVRSFFDASAEKKNYRQLFSSFNQLILELAIQAKESMKKSPRAVAAIDQIYSQKEAEISGIREGFEGEIDLQLQWFAEQVKSGAQGATTKTFSDDQEKVLSENMDGVQKKAVEESLIPILKTMLSAEEMKKLEKEGAISISIDHIGIEPLSFTISKAKELDTTVDPPAEVMSYQINAARPHEAMLGDRPDHHFYGTLKSFFSAMQRGELEMEKWKITVTEKK